MNTKLIQNLKIPATKGDRLIQDAKKVFWAIDPDFRRYKADIISGERKETALEVRELMQAAYFNQLFNDRDCLTHDQIIAFVETNKTQLHPDFWTFIPFKNGYEKFVARIAFNPQIKLRINIFRFDDPRIWNVEERIRLVVPASV